MSILLCVLVWQLKQPVESLRCYQTTLQLKPDHPHAYNNLGNALKDKGMIKEAVKCYTTAISCVHCVVCLFVSCFDPTVLSVSCVRVQINAAVCGCPF